MPNYTIGLDLGLVYDYTALTVIERLEHVRDVPFENRVQIIDHLRILRLQRWPHFTPYREILADVGTLIKEKHLEEAQIALDGTGVGKEVANLFWRAWQNGELGEFPPWAYIITGQRDVKGLKVPKRELVAKMQNLIEGGQLTAAPGVEFADVLMRELRTFQVKVSPSGGDSYESAREADHDDLVLAVALACWCRHTRSEPRYLPDPSLPQIPAAR